MEAGKELGLPSPSCLNNLYRNPDYKPTPTADFPGSGWGQRYGESLEERTAKGKVGAEGFWLWLEPSDLQQIKDWDKQGLMPQVLRYHVIACHQLLLENLKLTPNATSLQGESIVISVSQVREATSGRCPFSLGPLSFLFLRVVRGIITITTNACGVIAICQVLP